MYFVFGFQSVTRKKTMLFCVCSKLYNVKLLLEKQTKNVGNRNLQSDYEHDFSKGSLSNDDGNGNVT